jgi:hypothetical protein
VLWSHEINDLDYSLKSYHILWETNNMLDFLRHINRFAEDEWSARMFFFMRMGECLVEKWAEMKRINGISLSPKNNTTTVRIWNEENNHILNLQYQIPNIDQHKAIFRQN